MCSSMGGIFGLLLRPEEEERTIMGGCVYHYVVPFPDWWVSIRSSWELGGWERGGAGAVDWEPFPKHAGVVSFVFFLVITAL